MTPPEFLAPPEIHELTGKAYRRPQIDALIAMGVSFYVRPDGKPVVPRSQFRDHGKEEQEFEHNWDFLRAQEEKTGKPQTS